MSPFPSRAEWPGAPWHCAVLLLAALMPGLANAERPLPQRDLLIELREADSRQALAGAPGWSVRSADASAARERAPQQVRVLNGASASLRLTVTRPLQVWQAAPGMPQTIALAPGGLPPAPRPGTPRPSTAPTGTPPPAVGLPATPQLGASLPMAVPQTQWIEAGQHLTLRPRWPGGREPVTVTVSADSSRIDPSVAPGSAELPQQTGAQVVTTVSAPLGQWITLAAGGAVDDDMTVVASGQAAARRVLQLRVSLAP
jgi:hypothetical protein